MKTLTARQRAKIYNRCAKFVYVFGGVNTLLHALLQAEYGDNFHRELIEADLFESKRFIKPEDRINGFLIAEQMALFPIYK